MAYSLKRLRRRLAMSAKSVATNLPLANGVLARTPRVEYARVVNISKKKYASRKLVVLTYLASALLACIVGFFVLSMVVFAVYSYQLPSPDKLLNRSEELSTKILDRNGQSIYEVFGEKNRELVEIKTISPYLVHATLATEDSDFYMHSGFSLRGMLRAMKNTFFGGDLQGGSTLTQQVIKNTLLSQERTVTRKLKEFVLALQLESKYTKDEIAQMYLNETPYGGQNYGVLTAAKAYFNKDPKDLTIAESAYLAGLPQSPSVYSYYSSDPAKGLERKDYVLYLMNVRGWFEQDGKRHYLSDEDYEAAKKAELKFERANVSFLAPHFVFYVKELLAEKYGEDFVEGGGLVVTTTLDLATQQLAENMVGEEVAKAAKQGLAVGNGAMVVLDPKTGQILAMVGSKDYFAEPEPEGCVSGATGPGSCVFDPNLNVTLAERQPGSTIKPITYAALLSRGYISAFPFLDVPTTFENMAGQKVYKPENYSGGFSGVMSLRKSLGNSLNIPAVKALKMAGIGTMIDQAKKMGISTFDRPEGYGLALTLGGGETKLLEMAGAFSVFAANGIYRDPEALLEVKDAKGSTMYKWSDSGGTRALSQQVAFLISDILSDDGARSEAFGFNSLLHIPGHEVAAKTGTTDDKRDNYAIGFTPFVVSAVWVGNNNNNKMNPILASGITGATPIWNRFMTQYIKDYYAKDAKRPVEKFDAPDGVKKLEVDKLTGMLPYRDYDKRVEWFVNGTEPTAVSDWYQKLEVCKVDGKIANEACKSADKTKEKNYIKIQAELPEWQDEVDKWVSEKYGGDDTYFPPSGTSKLAFDSEGNVSGGKIWTDIVGFDDGQKVPLEFRLKVDAWSEDDIEQVEIYLGDKRVTTDKSFPYGYNFVFSPEDAGEKEFKVKAKDKNGRTADDSIKLTIE
ncbi:MAG: Penicillin-binding protein, 1A family [candidate division WWE3 bacterium GW2011_GWA2_44_16]|uniref:Penicillin-binding protein, 1A family n=2 Tax=Katanobacteria TaxID=422282 RepID=A0A0G1HDS0_UNCKA|nr:MAG: Penicillin-binding protein, 1A family [candidate division WWE3 bacterium GW2011_GWA2_44_16]